MNLQTSFVQIKKTRGEESEAGPGTLLEVQKNNMISHANKDDHAKHQTGIKRL